MLEYCLAFDPHYGICRVFYSESLGGWRQILNDGSHVSVTEAEMKHFQLFPFRSAFWISERNLVNLLLEQLDLSGVEDVYSEMMTAVRTLNTIIYISRERKPVKIGLDITRKNNGIHLRIGRLDDYEDEMINEVNMAFVDVPSLEYNLTTLVKAFKFLAIYYEFKQLSGKDIFDINNL